MTVIVLSSTLRRVDGGEGEEGVNAAATTMPLWCWLAWCIVPQDDGGRSGYGVDGVNTVLVWKRVLVFLVWVNYYSEALWCDTFFFVQIRTVEDKKKKKMLNKFF